MTHTIKGALSVMRELYLGPMTTTQRDALGLGGGQAGAIVFNTTTVALEWWNGSAWAAVQTTSLAATAVSVAPSGNLSSTTVQAALLELQADINNLHALQAADFIACVGDPGGGPELGADGFYAIDVTTGDVYGPRTAGVWGSSIGNAFSQLGLSSAIPIETDDDTGAAGAATTAARADHKHPRDQEANDLRTSLGTAAGAIHLGTFSGSTIDDDSTVKGALQALESAVEVPHAFVTSFNATLSWGAASGGYHSITLLASVHERGTTPIFQIEEGSAAPFTLVQVDQVTVNSSGDITFRVPSSPDGRFAGRIKVA